MAFTIALFAGGDASLEVIKVKLIKKLELCMANECT